MPEIGEIYSLSESFVSCSHLIWAMLALIGKVAERFRGMLYFRNLLIFIINLLSIKIIIIIKIITIIKITIYLVSIRRRW